MFDDTKPNLSMNPGSYKIYIKQYPNGCRVIRLWFCDGSNYRISDIFRPASRLPK